MEPIYLDYNATTPLDPAVIEAMRPYLETHFGNPSSSHVYGVRTKQAVEGARQQVAELLGARPEEIIFTSGGSESNNLALRGVAQALRSTGNHIVTSAIEHPAVTEVCHYLEQQGFRVTVLPMDETGLVAAEAVEKAITPATILVTIMHANNEVGTIQPIRAIADVAHRHGVLVHTDAAQSVGKIPTVVDELGVDLLSVAGHKLYAPKGVGALYVRTGVALEKLLFGADHERGWRAGTENVLEIVGLGKACALARERLPQRAAHAKRLRDQLHAGIRAALPEVRLNGHPEQRLPNTLSLSFPGIEARAILSESTEVAASAGAACHADQVIMSPTLQAMNVPVEYAMGTIRFSTGAFLTEAEVDRAVEAVVRVVRRLRPAAGSAAAPAPAEEEIHLTRFTSGLGCACKLRPQALEEVLAGLPRISGDPNVLVGIETGDDAAVYRIAPDLALVQTVDFFTPIVDDPFTFGAIAAANSLSDIYAMGGRPLFALSVVAFPSNRLPLRVLQEILRGGGRVAQEAGIAIIGGHTVDDPEPKFGLVVTGVVSPAEVWTNVGARPGDALILTKPLGTGVLTTALKAGALPAPARDRLCRVMMTLNRAAADALRSFEVHACTDVTGFGLLGHLRGMITASQVDVELDHRALPWIAPAPELALAGHVPGGTRANRGYVEPLVEWAPSVPETVRMLACDAQTSGGLLAAVPATQAEAAVEALRAAGVEAACIIGRVTRSGGGRMVVG
ncbi:MAG TPA: selenide, water dikinase SelD [Phycisphaerae bacterium]|nr:selenide, water dikinase SelD [Phycisphaerae bacterium]HNU46087.1 selenide, water dikinase SelD [Phycisphaerae bacterium]